MSIFEGFFIVTFNLISAGEIKGFFIDFGGYFPFIMILIRYLLKLLDQCLTRYILYNNEKIGENK